MRTLRKLEDVLFPVDDLQAAALEPGADVTYSTRQQAFWKLPDQQAAVCIEHHSSSRKLRRYTCTDPL